MMTERDMAIFIARCVALLFILLAIQDFQMLIKFADSWLALMPLMSFVIDLGIAALIVQAAEEI